MDGFIYYKFDDVTKYGRLVVDDFDPEIIQGNIKQLEMGRNMADELQLGHYLTL